MHSQRFRLVMHIKHMIMYEDGRFARHPRFRYFALNSGVLYKLEGSMFNSIHTMLSCLFRSCEEWSVLKGGGVLQPYPALCHQSARNKALLVKATKSSHCHGGHAWSAHSLTVQPTFSDQNLPVSSVRMILTPALLATKQSKRTLPSPTGSSTTASSSSLMPSTLEY